jgi:hypothetical protein
MVYDACPFGLCIIVSLYVTFIPRERFLTRMLKLTSLCVFSDQTDESWTFTVASTIPPSLAPPTSLQKWLAVAPLARSRLLRRKLIFPNTLMFVTKLALQRATSEVAKAACLELVGWSYVRAEAPTSSFANGCVSKLGFCLV